MYVGPFCIVLDPVENVVSSFDPSTVTVLPFSTCSTVMRSPGDGCILLVCCSLSTSIAISSGFPDMSVTVTVPSTDVIVVAVVDESDVEDCVSGLNPNTSHNTNAASMIVSATTSITPTTFETPVSDSM